MYAILHFFRQVIPRPVFDLYHRTLSWLASVRYGSPSKQLIIVGVTGTSGKTTTAYLIAKALEANGAKTGCMSTAFFKVGDHVWANATKMTMLGRFQLQKMLREMVEAGCTYAVVETTSQGIVQHRHEHVAYDVCVFTNLWPEHIESHGGFENYKRSKIRLFEYTATLPRKVIDGVTVPRVEVLNAGSEHAKDFVIKGFEKVLWFATSAADVPAGGESMVATDIAVAADHADFKVNGTAVHLQLPGDVNVQNGLAALAAASVLGFSLTDAARALSAVPGLPGRYERIEEGQPWKVIIDYAFEPVAMLKLYDLVASIEHQRIIHVLGATGGGRDASRRPVLGGLAGEKADLVIVTNEDPYDDDPRLIMQQVADGAVAAGKREGVDLFLVDDRGAAITMAMNAAQPGDVVLITGKGSEPVMVVAGGKKVPWSDAGEARRAIKEAM